MSQAVIEKPSPSVSGETIEIADMNRDRAEIEAVWCRAFGDAHKRFDNYLTNPYEVAKIWVYRPDGDAIRGAFGLHAQRLSLGGKVHNIGQIGNLAVDSEYRTAGPAVRIQRALLGSLKESNRTLLLGVTEDAIALLRRTRCKSVGTAQRWVKILRSESQLRKRLRSAALTKVAAPVVDAGLRLSSRETYSRRAAEVTVGFEHSYDSRYDRFWERVRSRFPIATQRTSEYLTWRFYGGQESTFQTFWMADAEGELIGYIVFEVLANSTIEVGDVMFDGTPALDCLLSEFLCHMRKHESRPTAITWVYFGMDLVAERLQRFGFKSRPERSQTFVYGDAETLRDAEPELFNVQRWYLSGADLDL